jgi:hypothetical protein
MIGGPHAQVIRPQGTAPSLRPGSTLEGKSSISGTPSNASGPVEAQVRLERWRRHHNEERPPMSLRDVTRAEFKSQIKSQSGCLGDHPERAIFQ